MIIAVEKFKELVKTDIADSELKAKLSALETAIRKYTNNNFVVRGTEDLFEIREGEVIASPFSYEIGDSVMIFSDFYRDEVFTIERIEGDKITLNRQLRFDGDFTGMLVKYPDDIVMGVINLMKWDISQREKIGIKSESISRWNVTYFDLEQNSKLGYPTSLLGFLKPHIKARF